MVYIPTGKEMIDPFQLLEEAGVRTGMKVADFGCGTIGHYVFPASRLVGPEGKVYAIDILRSVLNGIESRIKMESANNVELIWGDMERPRGVALPDESLDVALLINNLYLSKQREAMLKECVRTLKRGGKLVLADWKPTGIGFGPDPKLRVGAEEGRRLGEGARLALEKTVNPGKFHWGLIFIKP